MGNASLVGDVTAERWYKAFKIPGMGRGDGYHKATRTMIEASTYPFKDAKSASDWMLNHKMNQLEKYADALRHNKKIDRLIIVLSEKLPKTGPGAAYTNRIRAMRKAGLNILVRIVKNPC